MSVVMLVVFYCSLRMGSDVTMIRVRLYSSTLSKIVHNNSINVFCISPPPHFSSPFHHTHKPNLQSNGHTLCYSMMISMTETIITAFVFTILNWCDSIANTSIQLALSFIRFSCRFTAPYLFIVFQYFGLDPWLFLKQKLFLFKRGAEFWVHRKRKSKKIMIKDAHFPLFWWDAKSHGHTKIMNRNGNRKCSINVWYFLFPLWLYDSECYSS